MVNTQAGETAIESVLRSPTSEHTNPFYVHPGESPAEVQVSPTLNEKNFHSWIQVMSQSLESKNKLPFVDRSIAVPDRANPLYSAWKHCNTLVLRWLMQSIEPELGESLLWYDSVADLWDHLHKRFGRGDFLKIARLKRQISNMSQGILSINEFFSKYKALWDQLIQFRPVPVCKCENATHLICPAFIIFADQVEQDHIMGFLTGLNDSFDNVRTQILMMDPLPSMSRVMYLVSQHERQNLSGPSFIKSADTQTVLAAQSVRKFGYQRPTCMHCYREGHTVDKCFKLHGFSPSWKPKSKGNQGNQFVGASFVKPDTYTGGNFGFTAEQVQGLISMMRQTLQQGATISSTSSSQVTQAPHAI